mmetsp:Transcript_22744/g.76889  ORF Transcript_22744/g.76889 Transcript_22744/m.76889 type:complete len:304 (-) Transcript_22744:997-1908(-)
MRLVVLAVVQPGRRPAVQSRKDLNEQSLQQSDALGVRDEARFHNHVLQLERRQVQSQAHGDPDQHDDKGSALRPGALLFRVERLLLVRDGRLPARAVGVPNKLRPVHLLLLKVGRAPLHRAVLRLYVPAFFIVRSPDDQKKAKANLVPAQALVVVADAGEDLISEDDEAGHRRRDQRVAVEPDPGEIERNLFAVVLPYLHQRLRPRLEPHGRGGALFHGALRDARGADGVVVGPELEDPVAFEPRQIQNLPVRRVVQRRHGHDDVVLHEDAKVKGLVQKALCEVEPILGQKKGLASDRSILVV